jgi:hypothetical protein
MDPNKSEEIDEAQAAAILGAADKDKISTARAEASAPPTPPAGPSGPIAGAGPQPSFTPSPVSPTAPQSFGSAPGAPSAPAAPGQTPADIASNSFAKDSAPTGMVTPKKSKKPLVIGGIIIAVVFVLLGAGAAAYYTILNKPQNVLNMALLNQFSPDKVSSVNFEGSLDIKPKDSSTISTTFTGASNNDGAFTMSAKVDAVVTTIKVDMESADGKSYYLRFGGLDGIDGLLGMAGAADLAPTVASLNNQWLEITQGMLKQLTGTDTDLSSKLSDADRKKLVDAYKQNQFLLVSKTLKDESIKGKDSHHYQVTVDKTQLKNFVAAVKAANISSLKITSDNVKDFNKQADKTDFKKYPVDVWVSKADKLINQVTFEGTSDGDSYGVRYTVTDFNKQVKVEAPKDAKSLLEVLSALLTGSLGTGLTGTDDANSGFEGLEGISL